MRRKAVAAGDRVWFPSQCALIRVAIDPRLKPELAAAMSVPLNRWLLVIDRGTRGKVIARCTYAGRQWVFFELDGLPGEFFREHDDRVYRVER